MCGGVLYQLDDQEIKIYFPNPKAKLPVKKKSGDIELLPWGRRREEAGYLPMGGWARLESIQTGRWDRYFPQPVKLSILSFMEKDMEGKSHWFPLTNGQFIQGLVAHHKREFRVYVVTITPKDDNAIHDRWPRIMNLP